MWDACGARAREVRAGSPRCAIRALPAATLIAGRLRGSAKSGSSSTNQKTAQCSSVAKPLPIWSLKALAASCGRTNGTSRFNLAKALRSRSANCFGQIWMKTARKKFSSSIMTLCTAHYAREVFAWRSRTMMASFSPSPARLPAMRRLPGNHQPRLNGRGSVVRFMA